MPIEANRVSTVVALKMDGLSSVQRVQLQIEAGNVIVQEIKKNLAEGRSPIGQVGSFLDLTKKYADREKAGDRTPNLKLRGVMWSGIQFRTNSQGVEVGLFGGERAELAYYHHTGTPARPFIPSGSQKFRGDILRKIKKINDRYINPTNATTQGDQQQVLSQ